MTPQELFLTGNELPGFDTARLPPSIRQLYLDANKLRALPEGLASPPPLCPARAWVPGTSSAPPRPLMASDPRQPARATENSNFW